MRKILKIVGWIFAAVVVLLVVIVIALQTPFVQNYIAQQAVRQLSDRLGTSINVENVRIRIPRTVDIGRLYIEDQKQDTLWYSETITVELDMFGLLRNKITIHSLLLDNVTARVSRTAPDERFNFDFIPAAFAGDEPDNEKRDENNGSPVDISVNTVTLKNIRADYNDETGGDTVHLELDELVLGMDAIDLEDMRFALSRFDLHGLRTRVIQSGEAETVDKEPGEPADLNLAAGVIGLSSIAIEYQNKITGDHISLDLPSLEVNAASFASAGNSISASSVKIDRTGFMYRSPGVNEQNERTDGIDFSDLNITGLNVHIEDIYYSGETARADVHTVTLADHSGFALEELVARVNIDEQSARVDGLMLRTGGSRLQGSFNAEYPSLDIAREEPGRIRVDLSLDESFIGFGDALLLQPDLIELIQIERTDSLTLSASVTGTVDDLTIGKIEGSILESTYLRTYGRITGLPEFDTAIFDMTLEEVTTGREDIHRFVSADILPDNIVIPADINVSGDYKGSITEFDTFVDIRTTFGQIVAAMTMDMREEAQRYTGNLTVSRFNIGRLLDQADQLGMISLTASVDGSGFDEETIDAMLDATIDHAHALGYDYNDIRIDGRFRNRQFTGYAGMDDPNLTFTFNGDVHLTDEDPVFAFELDLNHADLHALKLVDEELSVSGMLRTDFTGASIESINGRASLRNVLITQDDLQYPVDSLFVNAATQTGHHHVTINSDLVVAEYEGSLNIIDLPPMFMDHMNRYFEMHDYDAEEEISDRYFTFRVELLRPELLSDILLPGLHNLSPALIEGNYTGTNHRLDVIVDIPELTYESYVLDSLQVHIESDRAKIDYDIRAVHFTMPGISVTAPEIYGSIEDNIISTNIALHDDERTAVFTLGGLVESSDTVFTISLVPGELVINYERWSVPEENFIRFGGDELYIHNVRLERAGSSIAARSIDDGTQAPPVEVTISDFDISDISRMLGNDELTFAGMLNARAELSDVLSELKLNVEMLLENFVFRESEVGTIEILAQSEIPDRYDLEVKISQHDNRARIAGYVLMSEGADELELTVDIQNITLASVEGFTMGELVDMDGAITGELTVTGSTASPDISGSVTFSDASFTVAQLNTRLRMEDEVIAFDRDGITFRNVAIVDSRGNRASVNGNIFTADFSDYRFALDIRSTNFMLMNTERRHNDQFFGRIIIDSDIRIRGDQNLPVINADIGFKDGTDLTLFVPEQDPEVIEREGIVEFVKMDERHQPVRDPGEVPDTIRGGIQGIELAANIEVDMQTRVRVMIDEQAGDYLQVRGGGTLSFGMDRSGLMSLAGRYEIREGAYQMTFYEVARRRFDIRPGSNIMWTGDPMEAEIDMTAIYTVRAQTVDLVADYVSDDRRQEYRRVLPYQVILNMKGELLAPDISFELDMPEEQRGAMGGVPYQHVQRINENETERNKQVFALLVLNRFLPENPFDLGEGAGVTATARTSASRLLTQQLNALSGRYVRGFDIEFDVESYEVFTPEGPEGRTELQLQVSRRFLEDRLIIELGGHFDLEGERARETNVSDIAGDVAVEYMLTEDGRFRVRGFRKTEYMTLGEGEVIFTGLSFVYAREFNRLMDLFRSPREKEPVTDPEFVGGEESE